MDSRHRDVLCSILFYTEQTQTATLLLILNNVIFDTPKIQLDHVSYFVQLCVLYALLSEGKSVKQTSTYIPLITHGY